MLHSLDTVTIGGFPTIRATRVELADLMVQDCLANRKDGTGFPKLVICSNGQGISMAGTDTSFAKAMTAANIVHADGMSVVIASRLLTRRPLPERITTTDFVHDAARAAAKAGLSFFLLGGTEAQNKTACETLRRLYPQLRIAGRHNGHDGMIEEAGDERLCAEIVASGADVLWVALGKPKQELWCVRNRERLRGVGWVKTCGGLFAFLTEEVTRAPAWMQNWGLEWLYRTMQEPSRLAWRYITTNPHAIYRMIRFSRQDHAAAAMSRIVP
ncbi:MAG TPA: WecB/TagA/CpsF family glycosyltransferase [Micropepsaceae bacterium]|jgi:exopolysaccharide biosynthesis WecB/TagA/CpsF family protein|nr:WecB/TagA/CpsF family glycosyltransferase [Micropepsaceae bacterium]